MTTTFTTSIVLHHVGGRGFDISHLAPGPFPGRFFSDVVHVVYEADAAAAREMVSRNPHPANFHVVPFALGARNCKATLNITNNPYASSLLLPDPEFNETTCEVLLEGVVDGTQLNGTYYDALYSFENGIAGTAETEVRALDDLLEQKHLEFNEPPDLMVLDSQGTEHDVLDGARKCLAGNVLAVATEIEFLPMYSGQKLASDMFKKMEENGFYFAGFTYLQGVSPYRTPLGLRAKEFVAFGDCIFLRRIDSVRRIATSPAHACVMLRKLAFISIAYGYVSYAMKALAELASCEMREDIRARLQSHYYSTFLDKLASAAADLPSRYLYTNRHVLAADVKRILEERPPPLPPKRYTSARAVGRLQRAWVSMLGGIPAHPADALAPPPPIHPPTPVEALLEQNGFTVLAAEVRYRRLRAEPFVAAS